MVRPKILESKQSDGLSVYPEKKSITIKTEDGMSVLEVANEHGNSVRYEISNTYRFDSLLAGLWQFVKDNQH